MTQRITQVDSFTAEPFHGNPAAVCILSSPAQAVWMQAVAQEMNLSETAFLHPEADGYRLRWFTPAAEVELCGHATLASAHVLWEEGHLPRGEPARFHTLSGPLTAWLRDGWIEMDFPAEAAGELDPPRELIDATRTQPVYAGANRFDYILELASEAEVRAVEPDLAALARLDVRGSIVTARAEGHHYDFVSRYFAPAVGIDEDPVTGSAHCCLGPYWQERLGRSELTGYQASRRGGTVRVRVDGDRVWLIGQAVTVLHGELGAHALAARRGTAYAGGE